MKNDKKLFGILFFLVLLTFGLLFGYMLFRNITEGDPYAATEDMKRKSTVDGYEDPEEVVEYVLYWIHQDDLDLALRGCAVKEVSEYFSLQSYCEILDSFTHTEILAPSDYDSKAYREINQARMTAAYSDMLEQCMGIMGSAYDVEVLNIYADVPEDADGFYYQDIRDIGSIAGSKDACNVVAELTVDGVPRRMTVTVGKYKKYWKILQFSEYKNYQYTEPQISEFVETVNAGELPISWEKMDGQRLPCNYAIAKDKAEEDIKKLIRRWFVYMQRGEIWKVMAYCDIYDAEAGLYPDSIFFSRQSDMAVKLQDFYYKLLLHDSDSLSWIEQNVKDEAVNLVSLLDTSSMIYTKLGVVKILEEDDGYARCRIRYSYSKKVFTCEVELTYRNGWKITNIGKVREVS